MLIYYFSYLSFVLQGQNYKREAEDRSFEGYYILFVFLQQNLFKYVKRKEKKMKFIPLAHVFQSKSTNISQEISYLCWRIC